MTRTYNLISLSTPKVIRTNYFSNISLKMEKIWCAYCADIQFWQHLGGVAGEWAIYLGEGAVCSQAHLSRDGGRGL